MIGDIDAFDGGATAFRAGAVRSAMRDIGQAPQRTWKAVAPHRRPRAIDRSPRCEPLVVHAPRRGPRL